MVEEGIVAYVPFPIHDVGLHAELAVDVEDTGGGADADETLAVAESYQGDMVP